MNFNLPFVKFLSSQVSPFQRINTVSPGHIYTKQGVWGHNSLKKPKIVQDMINEKIPLNRLANPEEVINVILFLSSSYSSYINGQLINVDGGMSIFQN